MRSPFRIALFSVALLVPVASVRACAVCFGDPDSDMAKGALAGVWVLVSIIGAVLLSIAGMGLFWIQRSRSLTRSDADQCCGSS